MGHYCQNCGQKNIVQHQGFWQLLTHFIYDIFHFDGQFFDTLKHLIFRPGKVPKEYVQGKRSSYLDPIRMYLFTSAVFFLVFFSISHINDLFAEEDAILMSKEDRFEAAARIFAENKTTLPDTFVQQKLAILLDTGKAVRIEKITSANIPDTGNVIQFREGTFRIYPTVDTLTFDDDKTKSEWVLTTVNTKWKAYKKKYGDNINKMMVDTTNRFVHWFPYILFVSLPLFAFILKLLYLRRKSYYYSDHAVFTLYHYIFSFILLLLFSCFAVVQNKTGWGVFNIVTSLLMLSWPVYLFLSMKRFYGQGTGKTFIKFLLVNLLGLLALVLIFIIVTLLFIYQL